MQAKLLNIPSYVEDPHYRYKMPRLQLKIEGKGNGIKTNIVNLNDAAKALRVPTEYPLKFLGHELGSQTTFKEKGNDVTSIINGSFKEDDIKNMLDKFIEKYVLCPNCKYPEMKILVKVGKVMGQCNSCGSKPELDNTHKLAGFIVKNPPKVKWDIAKTPQVEKKPVGIKPKKENGENPDEISDDGEEKKTDEALKKEEVSTTTTRALNRGAELTVDSQYIKDYVKGFSQEYQELAKDKENFKDDTETVKKLLTKLCSFDIPSNCRDRLSYVVFSGLFTVNIAKEITKNSSLLTDLFTNLSIGERESQIMINLEYHLFETNKDVDYCKYVPTILKFLYDEDLLTEDFLVEWYDKTPDTCKNNFIFNNDFDLRMKELSKDMVEWLRSAE